MVLAQQEVFAESLGCARPQGEWELGNSKVNEALGAKTSPVHQEHTLCAQGPAPAGPEEMMVQSLTG